MKYTVKYSTLFKKSFKKCMKRGCSEDKFRKVISILSETGTLPPEYKPHPLKSNYKRVYGMSHYFRLAFGLETK